MNGSKEKKWTDDDLEYAIRMSRNNGCDGVDGLRGRKELLEQLRDMIDRELNDVNERLNSAIEAQKTITNFFKEGFNLDDLFKGM